MRATYYAMNVEADWLLGNVLNTSYSLGWNASNTIIIFTSDHG
ncbi:MAG: sulfatase-like hydrolase/transferase, partial [Colwellia sp.]|nr:sulfatase-like hydrolase/transferase [Colwellia sp.]